MAAVCLHNILYSVGLYTKVLNTCMRIIDPSIANNIHYI